MAQLCRAVAACAFAVVVARAGLTIRWNVASPAPAASPAAVQTALVKSVRGTRVILRLGDGTTREFIAPAAQARELQRLVGTAIRFTTP